MWKLFKVPESFHATGDEAPTVVADEPIEEEPIEEEEEEETETEDEEEPKEEEEPELARFSLAELKEAFKDKPEIYKSVKHAFFREQQFTEIYPTVEEARKAAEAQSAYEEITSAVVEGDAEKFLTELKAESGEGLEKFAKNFIPALQEADKDLFLDITEPIVKQYLRNAYAWAGREGGDTGKNVAAAAKVIHKILFGGEYSDIERDAPLTARGRTADKDKKDNSDKDKFLQSRHNELRGEVANLCYSQLDAEINKGLEDLTKTKPGLKKLIAKDVKERILDAMDKDPNYMTRINGLWGREKRNGFSGTLKQSFVTTFMGKAKTLVTKYRAEARREALGKDDVTPDPNKRRATPDRSSSGKGPSVTVKDVKEKNLSTRAIFDS